ncbi:hypothetical protein MVEG_04186 [Podila verticillata NRRL 6337]|nr:hypothetical protein MVEG_04186 [Podila verticillata NRRL 6337]
MGSADFESLDTPVVCNHADKDNEYTTEIIDGVVTARSFNLVLIAINPLDPLTAEQLLALQCYSEVLEYLRSKVTFVFTHVEYDPSRLNSSSQSSEPVNITAASVEQSMLIAHPSSFDDKQRKDALDRIHRESGQQSKVDVKHAKAMGRAATDDVNILLIDDVVSGKTYLIEAMKSYAKPGPVTNEKHIMRGRNNAADEIF